MSGGRGHDSPQIQQEHDPDCIIFPPAEDRPVVNIIYHRNDIIGHGEDTGGNPGFATVH